MIGSKSNVPNEYFEVNLGDANVMKEGDDITIVSYGYGSKVLSDSAKKLESIARERALAYDGANILNFMLEQIEENHKNPTTYFFHDESELEISVKEAAYAVVKFNELSDEHKEAFVENLGATNQFLSRFINM